jgi:long-chain fatty acid transport protein
MRTLKSLLVIACIAPALALANGYDVPNVNPRDLAMAGSGVAAQNDAAAAYANPAALSKLGPGLQLSLAGSGLFLSTKWADNSGLLTPPTAKTKFMPVPPVSLFGAYGFKLAGYDTAIGAGLNVPAGGNVFWDEHWAGRGRIITVDRKIYAGYLTAGMAFSPAFRFGGGLVYYYGTEYLKQGIQPFQTAYAELSTKGGAASVDVSFEADASDTLTFGADFKYLGTMKLKGDAHFNIPPALAGLLQDQGATHELTYPSVLNAGFSWKATRSVLVTGAFTYNWYEVYKADDFVGDKAFSLSVPRHYKNGQTYRLGVEYTRNPRLQLRAGLLRDLSGLNTDYYSASLPDSNAWAGSVGAGWMLTQSLQLNATVFYALLDKVTVTGTHELPGSYNSNVWIASVGVSWKTGVGGGAK